MNGSPEVVSPKCLRGRGRSCAADQEEDSAGEVERTLRQPEELEEELPKARISQHGSAIAHSRTSRDAAFRIDLPAERRTRDVAIGSVTSSRITTAEAKEVSMARAYLAYREPTTPSAIAAAPATRRGTSPSWSQWAPSTRQQGC